MLNGSTPKCIVTISKGSNQSEEKKQPECWKVWRFNGNPPYLGYIHEVKDVSCQQHFSVHSYRYFCFVLFTFESGQDQLQFSRVLHLPVTSLKLLSLFGE